VVLAATATGFSSFFPSLSRRFFFLSFSFLFLLSMLTLFPISKYTVLLTGYYKKEHDDERTFRVIVRKKREKKEETKRLPRCSLSDIKNSFVLMLSFFVIILLQAPGLFPFPHPISSFLFFVFIFFFYLLFCYFKVDLNRQISSSVDQIIIIIIIIFFIKDHVNAAGHLKTRNIDDYV